MLQINNLHVGVEGKKILKGIDLEVKAGEVHVIMGPNASGKSTLAYLLAGRETYEIQSGEVRYEGRNLLVMSPEERAREGIFLAFQYPIEIPGLNTAHFLRAALNAVRRHRGLEEMDAMEFLTLIKEKIKLADLGPDLIHRPLNEGFSGGEKKRNEILQMAILEPRLAILDETDSGLDVDALKTVAGAINAMRSPNRAMIIITHYQRLLNYMVPDYVHIMIEGRIMRSGGRELALEVEEKGYGWLEEQVRLSAAGSASKGQGRS